MSETTIFSIYNEKDEEIKTTLQEVYDALQEKGYNPINQIIGYILSEDPTYITTHRDARKKSENLTETIFCKVYCVIISNKSL